MILDTWARFHAATNIDPVGMYPLDRLDDVVDTQAAGENQPARVDAVEPLPRKLCPRTAVTGRKRIEQIKISRNIVHAVEGRLLLHANRLDHFHIPAAAIRRALLTVEL